MLEQLLPVAEAYLFGTCRCDQFLLVPAISTVLRLKVASVFLFFFCVIKLYIQKTRRVGHLGSFRTAHSLFLCQQRAQSGELLVFVGCLTHDCVLFCTLGTSNLI